MRADIVMRMAVWLVERDGAGSAGEAFAGDLLETFSSGRSRWWCLGQALRWVASSLELRLQALQSPLWFCMAFVLLHPLWMWICAPLATRLLTSYRNTVVWPGSAVLEIVAGLFPAVIFVWIGVFVFLALRRQAVTRVGWMGILLALSTGLGVVSAATMLRLGATGLDLHMLSRTDFYYPVSHSRFSALLFLGLFAAIGLLPRERGLGDRRQDQGRVLGYRKLLRIVRSLWLMALLVPQVYAQNTTPQQVAAKRLMRLVDLFNGNDWNVFHAAYVASFVQAPPEVPLGIEFFRQRTEGLDLRKLEEDTPTKATLLVQEHDSDQFARISVEVEPAEPHRIVQLQMGAIERPAEFPYGSLTDAEVITQARTRLHALADAGHFAGVMLIQRDGRTVYSDVLGEADRTLHIANAMDTRFRIGSMNKMFTAVATLQLVAAGKLQLDQPIGCYLPEYPNKDAAAKVTVRHLLTHTGGTGDFFGPDFDAHRLALRTHEDFVLLFGPRSLLFKPGTRFEYSNFGFLILGAIIDRVSGQNYYQYVQDHVYKPAGMSSTGSEPEDVVVPRRSIGYTQADGKPWRPNDATLPYRGASAGGGYTTAGDLLLFAAALQANKLLNAEDTQLLLTPSQAREGGERYGFGFQVDRQPSGTCFGHSGGAPGQAAMLEVCPQAGYTIVWLANIDPPGALLLTEYLVHRLPQR